jgi:hypothetical protein
VALGVCGYDKVRMQGSSLQLNNGKIHKKEEIKKEAPKSCTRTTLSVLNIRESASFGEIYF